MKLLKTATCLLCFAAALLMSGCGGTTDASIGGSVSGLSGGTTVVLLNNSTDALTVSSTGSFTFSSKISSGSTYNVTIETQPAGETCTVSKGSGTVSSSGSDVTDVQVTCVINTTATNDVFGTVTGLSGTLVLLDNGTNSLSITSNGSFVFSNALSIGATYSVTISSNPTGQTCAIANGSGTIPSSGTITAVVVTCS